MQCSCDPDCLPSNPCGRRKAVSYNDPATYQTVIHCDSSTMKWAQRAIVQSDSLTLTKYNGNDIAGIAGLVCTSLLGSVLNYDVYGN